MWTCPSIIIAYHIRSLILDMDHEFIHTQRALIEHNFEEAVKKNSHTCYFKTTQICEKNNENKKKASDEITKPS